MTLQEPVEREASTTHTSRSAADPADNHPLSRKRTSRCKCECRCPAKKKRTKRPPVETPEYAKGMRRQLASWLPRIMDGDPSDWAELRDFHTLVGDMVRDGARSLNDKGTSWTVLAAAVGISRQGARQQWARTDEEAS